jgi:hypothetical protein
MVQSAVHNRVQPVLRAEVHPVIQVLAHQEAIQYHLPAVEVQGVVTAVEQEVVAFPVVEVLAAVVAQSAVVVTLAVAEAAAGPDKLCRYCSINNSLS